MKLAFDTVNHVHFLRRRKISYYSFCIREFLFSRILLQFFLMPHIQINSSTPETRRRELLLKSLRINEIFKLALEEAKLVIRSNIENKKAEDLSYAEQYSQSDIYELNSFLEYTTILPPMDCVGEKLLLNEDEFKDQLLVSTIVQEFHDYKKELSMTSTYRPNLVSDDDVDSRECKPHFITCLSMDPNFAISSHGRRHRTSSLPNSTMIFSLSASTELSNHRCTNLGNLTLWQNNPQQIIYLFNRQYHCQPMSKFDINKFLLANSKHIDIYNIQTGCCDEKMCFQSSNINYIAICYNKYKDELFVASTSSLYIYNLLECKVNYEIHLPGFPFSLDHNDQVRYLVCNSSSIYHGYFSFTPTCTSTVLSRLSQFEFRHVCDLEFDDLKNGFKEN